MDTSKYIGEITKDIEKPLEYSGFNWIKKGKVGIFIFYEDSSFYLTNVKLKDNYFFTVKKKSYFMDSKKVKFNGSRPHLFYFFNNPFPIDLKYQPSKLTSDDIIKAMKKMGNSELINKYGDVAGNVTIDASGLNAALNSNLINKMYADNVMSTKNIIIIIIVALIVILILLQVTGTVDILGALTNSAKQISGG